MKDMMITSPLNGKVIPLEEVPDPVFAGKMMGDGCAVVPSDGKVCSPINGTVKLVAATKHAIGLETEDGVEVLVHFGLETVELNGEGFDVKVEAGDKVKQGDLLMVVDYDGLKAKNINLITPVVICTPIEGKELSFNYGNVKVKDKVMTIAQKKAEVVEEPKKKKKFNINFDFLQKLGKVLMGIIRLFLESLGLVKLRLEILLILSELFFDGE